MSTAARFQLFVKAGKDGKCVGDCPFSQRANMYAHMTLKDSNIEVTPVNTIEKPDYFLKIYPEGKVPVLVDRGDGNKVVPDSAEITKYLNQLFSKPELQQSYSGPGCDAASGVFPKFAGFMMNKDKSKEAELKQNLIAELKKLDDFLASQSGSEYIICNNLCELDCQVLPKLRHVQVAGKHYKDFNIPDELTDLQKYIKCGEANTVFQNTCPADEEIIWGWSKYFT